MSSSSNNEGETIQVIDAWFDFNQQSIEIDDIEHIRVAPSLKGGKPLIEYYYDNVRTLNDVLRKGMEISNDGRCLGTRSNDNKRVYKWITYSEVMKKVEHAGSGLINKGVKADNSTNIGIYAKNRAEWVIAEHACYKFNLTVVALYDSYGKDSTEFILNQAEIGTVFVDNYERLKNIFANIDKLPHLRLVIHFEYLTETEINSLNVPKHIELISFSKLLEIGEKYPKPSKPPKPDDIATICYTSGTTGNPKGVILTHGNFISQEAGVRKILHKPHLKVLGLDSKHPTPVWISYLPLAHMFERITHVKAFLEGSQIGYYSGDVKNLLDDCKVLKPTNMSIVPRLLNRMYDRVHAEIGNSKFKLALLNKGIAVKEADRKSIIKRNTIYDTLVFNKIRAQLGGNLIRMASGSAPLSKEVMEFSRSVFSCPIPEGYGQTEATCGITFTHPLDPELGHVGGPLECVMVKLVDIPEFGYYAKDGKGEICAKGPSIFKGYYKEPEKTAEVIDKDGWLHTGDVGMWLPNGCLKIIDRKKHLFKLSQGEYIAPEKIESVYLRSCFVAQIFVEGDSLRNFIIAIVVPDEDYLTSYCKRHNISGTFKELCIKPEIKKLIFDDMNEIAQKHGLMSFEKSQRHTFTQQVIFIRKWSSNTNT